MNLLQIRTFQPRPNPASKEIPAKRSKSNKWSLLQCWSLKTSLSKWPQQFNLTLNLICTNCSLLAWPRQTNLQMHISLESLSSFSISKESLSKATDQKASGHNWIDLQPLRAAKRNDTLAEATVVVWKRPQGCPIGRSHLVIVYYIGHNRSTVGICTNRARSAGNRSEWEVGQMQMAEKIKRLAHAYRSQASSLSQ